MEKQLSGIHPSRLLLMAALMASGACAPRSVPPASAAFEGYAIIRGPGMFSLASGATLAAIDGKTLLFEKSVNIPPGTHVARACYESPLSSYQKCADLKFTAQSGHTYVVCGSSRGWLNTDIHLWIKDERSGATVAGDKPLE